MPHPGNSNQKNSAGPIHRTKCSRLGSRILPPDYARLNDIQSRMIDVWDSEAEKYGLPLPLRSIHNAENKKLRIERILFSLLENHKIRFHPHGPAQRLLKEQLLDLFDGSHIPPGRKLTSLVLHMFSRPGEDSFPSQSLVQEIKDIPTSKNTLNSHFFTGI